MTVTTRVNSAGMCFCILSPLFCLVCVTWLTLWFNLRFVLCGADNKLHLMNKFIFSLLILSVSLLSANTKLKAQVTAPKIVVVNGGRFEFSPPFADFVTVGVYDRATRTYQLIDTINDQSVQDVITFGKGSIYVAYVLSQTTLTAYNLNTGQMIAQRTGLLGGSKLGFVDQENFSSLIVTRGFGTPAGDPYVLILNQNNLNTVASITGISDECGHVVTRGTKAYVSVPGNFMSTSGNIAVIDLLTNRLEQEIQLGTKGKGIERIFYKEDAIVSVNNGGYQSPRGTLSVLFLDQQTPRMDTTFDFPIANAAGIVGNNLYARLTHTDGIGSFDLARGQIQDSLLIKRSFAIARVDSSNQSIILTDANYSTPGKARIYNLQGLAVDSFNVGVSPEAVAVAYFNASTTLLSGTSELDSKLVAFPNPANETLYVKYGQLIDGSDSLGYKLYNNLGQVVLVVEPNSATSQVSVQHLPSGTYYLRLDQAAGALQVVIQH